VAGIGNIFLGDDGFGVEVANRLSTGPVPPGVQVADYGIRGVHLAYELLEGYDALVLVDAVPMEEPPGTLALIEPDLDAPDGAVDGEGPTMDAHSMNPAVVLGMLSGLGGRVDRVVVVGCQPANLDEGIGLSPPVAAAVDRAVEVVGEVLLELGRTNEEKTRA
jgi:hydrogenase maturation protease